MGVVENVEVVGAVDKSLVLVVVPGVIVGVVLFHLLCPPLRVRLLDR